MSGEASSSRGTEQQKRTFVPETPELKPELEAQVQEEVAGFEGKRLGIDKEGTDKEGGGEYGGPKGPEPTRCAPVESLGRLANRNPKSHQDDCQHRNHHTKPRKRVSANNRSNADFGAHPVHPSKSKFFQTGLNERRGESGGCRYKDWEVGGRCTDF